MAPARLGSWLIELLWLAMRFAIGMGFAIVFLVIAKAFQAAAMDRWHDRFSFDAISMAVLGIVLIPAFVVERRWLRPILVSLRKRS